MEARSGNSGAHRNTPRNGNAEAPRRIWDETGLHVSQVADWVRDGSSELINAKKVDAAHELTTAGSAIRRAADKLNDQNRAVAARYVETAAQKVEQAGRYLEELELNQFIADAEAVARRRPALFLGGMFIVGLAAARFVKVAIAADPQPSGARKRESARRHAASRIDARST